MKLETLRKCLLGLDWVPAYERFEAYPQRTFRPNGLMLWGDDLAAAWLDMCLIGCDMQVMVSCARVPARFFALAKSYEQLRRLVDEGCELAGWPSFNTVPVGTRVAVRITDRTGRESFGPDRVQACFWGVTIE